jgi:NADH-quinone oxidoreductase subunit L
VPLVTSLVVALGGLTLGYLVYQRYQLERPDPLARPLGGIYYVLQHKYFFDEIYHAVFIKNAQRLSAWLFRFDDLWVIDPIVDGVGKLGRQLSEINRWIDTNIVDAVVNGAGAVATWMGNTVRLVQTGKAQNYMLVGLVALSVVLGAYMLLPK